MNLLDKPYILLQDSSKDKKGNIREWIYKYLYLWPWILFSLLLCLIIALLYNTYTPAKYEIKAKVYIKDQNRQHESQMALKELELFRDEKAVDTEIEVLKSMQLLRKVVKDLNLNTTYHLQGFPVNTELYDTIPIVFIPVNVKVNYAKLKIHIKDPKTFILETDDVHSEYGFGKLQRSMIGSWLIAPESDIEKFIGQTINIKYTNPEMSAAAFLSQLDVSQTNKLSTMLELTLKDNIPERGQAILNSLIKNYNEDSKGEKNRIATGALEFIDNRLKSLGGELAAAEKSVEGYRSSNSLTDISAESELFLDQVQNNDNRLNEVNVQLKVLDEIDSYINSNSNGNAPSTVGIADPTLIDLITRLNAVQSQRENLLGTNSEANPLLEPLDRQIRSTKLAIRDNISSMRSSLRAVRGQLNRYNNGFEASIQQLPGQERQLVDFQRKQSIKENLYVYLMQKREEVALSFASTLPENRVVDTAFFTEPYWPKKSYIYFFAISFGLLIPASFLFGKSAFYQKITSRVEIEDSVDIPIISELIHQDGKPVIVLDDRRNLALAEQFRSLRTDLKRMHTSEQGRVTLITSSVGNEGKSFVSSNLAVAFAVSGRKTVLLELDLRKPRIMEMFGISSEHPGVSDLLLGEADLNDIIQTSNRSSNLDVIGSGKFISNPAELLEDSALDTLIADLKLIYDDIILDTPPVHLVTDAFILSRFADVSLYIVRQGITSKSELSFISQLVKNQKLPKMSIVFNGIHRMKYGYGYNYDKSYYGKRNLRLN